MKKLLITFFLLLCLAITILATVDLAPYLQSSAEPSRETDAIPAHLPEKATFSSQTEKKEVALIKPEFSTKEEKKSKGIITPDKPVSDIPIKPEEPAVTTPDELQATAVPSEPQQTENQTPPDPGLNIPTYSRGLYPYSVLLDTFDEKNTVVAAVSTYREKGLSPYWVKVNLGKKGIKYRLFTGFFPTTAAATTYLEEHNITGKPIKPTKYTALVGLFDKKQPLEDMKNKLKTFCFPYSIQSETGPYFLFVGSFYTINGATEQCAELHTENIPCTVIKRGIGR